MCVCERERDRDRDRDEDGDSIKRTEICEGKQKDKKHTVLLLSERQN